MSIARDLKMHRRTLGEASVVAMLTTGTITAEVCVVEKPHIGGTTG
jgi:hypothetical protein